MYQRGVDQGQIVDISYTGWRDGVYYRRVIDRSDRTESWAKVSDDTADMGEVDDVAETLGALPESVWLACEEPEDR